MIETGSPVRLTLSAWQKSLPLYKSHTDLFCVSQFDIYKIVKEQEKKPNDNLTHLQFYSTSDILNDKKTLNVLKRVMSDEPHFYMFGYTDKENHCYWNNIQSKQVILKPLHSVKITAHCGMSAYYIIKL